MNLTEDARRAWKQFLDNQFNCGHAQRVQTGSSLDEHVDACMTSSRATAVRVKSDLPELRPFRILEIGSSAGLNCYALQEVYPDAQIIGIEPEIEAITVARLMSGNSRKMTPRFIQGAGENVPLKSHSIDLIICHTVIEHVRDVNGVISEFSRLLTKNGVVHLDAPNYIWPYEPHLQIWTLPMLGKSFVKLSARLQRKASMTDFLQHLQFVTPFSLQRCFRRHRLKWENRTRTKLVAASTGKANIKQYRIAAGALAVLGKLGIAKLVVHILLALGFYPSVMYTIKKADNDN